MVHVLLAGESRDLIEIAGLLTRSGYDVTLLPRSVSGSDGELAASGALRPHEPHLLSAREGDERQVRLSAFAAYDDGSSVPALADQPRRSAGRIQKYQAGDRILVPMGSLLRLTQGVIALSAVHADGAEVMIGMLGPGDYVLPHPEDSCHVEAFAQTDVQAELLAWHELAADESLVSALASRVLRSEAWAAAQAHPYIEQRLLGILGLLGEQFGDDHQEGRLINVRITHGQLAAITGATRPTITRVIASLRRAGRIAIVGTGADQRLCVFDT